MPSSVFEILLAAGSAAGAIAAIYKIYRPAWGFLVKVKDRMFAGRRLETQVLALTSAVAALSQECKNINAQLQNNGGSSIKDSLDRIEARQTIFEQRQRVQFSESPYGVLEMDSDGRGVWVNRRLCLLLERLPEDLLGYGWRNAIAPDERDRFFREWEAAIEEHREFERYAHLQASGGKRIRAFIRTQKLMDGKGQVVGWMTVFEPVSITSPDYQGD